MADTTRHAFFCQDDLWQSFMEFAAERAQPVDDLICEAMSQYMRGQAPGEMNNAPYANQTQSDMNMSSQLGAQQQFQAPGQPQMGPASLQPTPPAAPQNAYSRHPVSNHQPAGRQPYGRQQPPSSYASQAPMMQADPVLQPQAAPIQPPPAPQTPPAPPAAPPAPPAPPAPLIPPPITSGAPISPSIAPPPPAGNFSRSSQGTSQLPSAKGNHQPIPSFGSQPPLYIIFANQKYTVDKDKFIIGRSSQMADLVIRDGNISRKHCAIIFKNGAYYIKDLDSTNGIEYKGNRIDTKKIEEGDKYNICEFQFTFTYQ